MWAYHYIDDGGNRKKIRRINLSDLKDEVLARGMEWKVVDEELADKSMSENNDGQTKLM